jgi:hypothetical protein
VPVEHRRDEGRDQAADAESPHIAPIEPHMEGRVGCKRSQGNDKHDDDPRQSARFHVERLLLPCGKDARGEQHVSRFDDSEVLTGVQGAVPERGHAGTGAKDSRDQRRLPVPVGKWKQPCVSHPDAMTP